MKHRLLTTCLITALLSIGCGGDDREFNTKPVFESLTDQVVAVNTELRINLRASDADNDTLRFFFGADIPDINQRARIDPAGTNTAIFKWTPLASDVGVRAFDFSVSDGSETTKQTIQVDVRPAVGASTAPRFIRPKGSGTALDLGQEKCMEIDVEVLDDDSPAVDIKQENELLGSDLQQLSGLSAKWSWCPSDAQIEADSTYELRLSADDGDNPAVMRDPYQITPAQADQTRLSRERSGRRAHADGPKTPSRTSP